MDDAARRRLDEEARRLEMYWVLDENGEPRLAEGVLEWARFLEDNKERRTVAVTELHDRVVWTYFLGLDGRISTMPSLLETAREFGMSADAASKLVGDIGVKSKPILWESASGLFHVYDKYTSKNDALVGHELIVAKLRAGVEP